MTFTVALQVQVTTPSGIEEKIAVSSQELTTELVQTISGKISDLISGENQIQEEDVINTSGSVSSDEGGAWSFIGSSTKNEVSTFSDFINSVLNPQ